MKHKLSQHTQVIFKNSKKKDIIVTNKESNKTELILKG
jgi:hypothetical protein